jgi:flagellar protein FliJ
MTSAAERNVFRLATLLRLRELARDECRESLAEALRSDAELARQLAQLDAEQQSVRNQCRQAAAPGEVRIIRLVEACRYLAGLQAQEDQLQAERDALAGEIDRRRQSLLKADQDVRVLEKLQDRRRESRRQEEERQQAKLLDEAALLAVTSPANLRGAAALRRA